MRTNTRQNQEPSDHDTDAGIVRCGIDRADMKVLFADLQPTLVTGSRSVTPAALASGARVLAHIARLANVPTTFSVVQADGKPGVLIPELLPYANQDAVFHRLEASTFADPELTRMLASHRRKVLVVSGFATEVAVLESALGAIDAGYTVHVPVDAIGGRSFRTEAAALRQMEIAGAVPTSIASLAAMFTPVFSRPPGDAVLAALAALAALDDPRA